ncbi:MAG: chemotaxis-specific protein-glutamate methyltransferase CheB [Bacteriovoracia bacterium]
MKEYFLDPGEIIFSSMPCNITTVLGSCIAVCLYDKRLSCGGVCHYYLPDTSNESDAANRPNKYGVQAIPNLLRKFKEHGSAPKDIVAKVVGGGHVVSAIEENDNEVGQLNIKIARELLKRYSIPIVAEDVGGLFGRKILFSTSSGEIKLKKIQQVESKKVHHAKLKVLVVDDSKPVRTMIRAMVEKDSSLMVIGEAEDGIQGQELIIKLKPDVITLDINMPRLDGVSLLKEYMATNPIPTIMVSALGYSESGPVFQALEEGAFDYFTKPDFKSMQEKGSELVNKIKAAYAARGFLSRKKSVSSGGQVRISQKKSLDRTLIAIGASTGGTEALKNLLTRLPANIPPIVIVQHIPPIFSQAFATRLGELCAFNVKEANNGDILQKSVVYIAPGGKQMKVVSCNDGLMIKITDDEPVNRFKPSVDYLFKSLLPIKSFSMMALILTGMGDDGAQGLLQLKNNGVFTVGQDENSCAVYGMPKVAYDIGATSKVVSLDNMPYTISRFLES